MKKPTMSGLVLITLLFVAFTLGLFLGNGSRGDAITVNVPESLYIPPAETHAPTEASAVSVHYPLDLNSASQAELMTLPGIGEKLALRILQYRWFQGRFTSVDELTMVEGIGEKKLEEIRHLITIGG